MNEWQGNGYTGATEGMTLRGFGRVPGGDGQLPGRSLSTRLRTACPVETGKEAQRKPGRMMMDGSKRLGSGRADLRKRGMAMGREDPRKRPSEAHGEGTGAGGEPKRKRVAGTARLS